MTDDTDARVLPHDLTAERAILGAMLMSAEACNLAMERVRPGDFFRVAHQEVYRAGWSG